MGLVLLVRHGQASFGAADYDVLSETGRRQSELVGAGLAGEALQPAVVVHGGLARQRDTALALRASAGWAAPVELDEGWAEFDHLAVLAAHDAGLSGITDAADFQRHLDAALAAWVGGAESAAEPFADFWSRVGAGLERACAAAADGRVVVVVTSGGPIAAVAARLLDPAAPAVALARSWQRLNAVMVNASYSRVISGRSGPRLLTFNEHAPLIEAGLVTHR